MNIFLDVIHGWTTTPKSQTTGESPSTQSSMSIAHLHMSYEMQVVEFELMMLSSPS